MDDRDVDCPPLRALPAGALLNRYSGSGAFADCYVTEVAKTVSHAEFVEAFVLPPVFSSSSG